MIKSEETSSATPGAGDSASTIKKEEAEEDLDGVNDVVDDDDDDDDDDGDMFQTDDSPERESTSAPPDVKIEGKQEEKTEMHSAAGSGAIPRKDTSIPRKSESAEPVPSAVAPSTPSPAPAPAPASAAEPTLLPSKFGLPEAVTIPASVHAGLLQGKLLDSLKGLPIQLINDALTEYDDAVQIKGSAIRNHGAYLYGVIKRYVNVQTRASRGEGDGILPMGQDLTPAVQERLEQLVQSKFCTQEEMNDKVKSKIRMLSEKDALVAIDELANVERSQIRNFGSYFMGILNRYMRGQAGPAHPHQKDNRGGHDHHQQHHNHHHQHHRGGGGGGRFGDRRRDERDGDGFRRGRGRGHGRDNDRYSRDSYSSHGGRERSRDRYDDGNDHYRREADREQRYDHRQQQQFHGQPNRGMGGGVPPPPRNPYGPQQPYMQQHQRQGFQQPSQADQKQPFVSQMGSGPPNRPGVPPVNPLVGQQNPQNLQQQPMGSHHQQNTMHHQAMPGQQPQQQYLGNQQQPLVLNQPVMNQQQQHQHPQHHQQQHQQQHQHHQHQHQQHQHQHQQHQQHQQQYMGGQQHPQQSMNNQQQQYYMGNQQQQPQQQQQPRQQQQQQPQGSSVSGSYSQTPGGWQQPQGQPQGQVPVDILGLADKAASAVQALASQNKLQLNSAGPPYSAPPVPAGPPYSSTPGPMGTTPPAPPMSYPNPNTQTSQVPYSNSSQPPHPNGGGGAANGGGTGAANGDPAFRRRTATAGIGELPMMVQYAVQNLQATGQVDGPLDEGMLGMIKDLPEALALGALQKFSTIDKNTVRNKTAYLAGVLRRELERINRR